MTQLITIPITTEKNAVPKSGVKAIQYWDSRDWPDAAAAKAAPNVEVRFAYYCAIGWTDPDAAEDSESRIRHSYFEMAGYENCPKAKTDREFFIRLLYHRAIGYTDPDAKRFDQGDEHSTISKEYFLRHPQDPDAKKYKDASIRKAFYRSTRWTDPDAAVDPDQSIQLRYFRGTRWRDYRWLKTSNGEVLKCGFYECTTYPESEELYTAITRLLLPLEKDGTLKLSRDPIPLYIKPIIRSILIQCEQSHAMFLLAKYRTMDKFNKPAHTLLVEVLKKRKDSTEAT